MTKKELNAYLRIRNEIEELFAIVAKRYCLEVLNVDEKFYDEKLSLEEVYYDPDDLDHSVSIMEKPRCGCCGDEWFTSVRLLPDDLLDPDGYIKRKKEEREAAIAEAKEKKKVEVEESKKSLIAGEKRLLKELKDKYEGK